MVVEYAYHLQISVSSCIDSQPQPERQVRAQVCSLIFIALQAPSASVLPKIFDRLGPRATGTMYSTNSTMIGVHLTSVRGHNGGSTRLDARRAASRGDLMSCRYHSIESRLTHAVERYEVSSYTDSGIEMLLLVRVSSRLLRDS